MKNFDLNSYGVQEMDGKVMEETNGGFLLAAACITLAAAFLAGQTIALYHGLDPEGSHGQKLH